MNHPLFGTKHLILIAISLVLIVILTIYSRKLKFKTVCTILFFVGICSELIKIFYYIIVNEQEYGGVLPKTDLPFHLCSIQIIFIAVVNFAKSEKLRRFILSFMIPSCLYGGIAAILIATDSARNAWVITGQYFLYHIAITVFALRCLCSKDFKRTIGDYFNCLKFLLVLLFAAIYINSIIDDYSGDVNFMYVVKPPQDGLPFLTNQYGWLVYIVHYACLILLCVSLCYCKPIVQAIKARFAKAQPQEAQPDANEVLDEVAVTVDTPPQSDDHENA